VLEGIEQRETTLLHTGDGQSLRQPLWSRDLEADPSIPDEGQPSQQLTSSREIRGHDELARESMLPGDARQRVDEGGNASLGGRGQALEVGVHRRVGGDMVHPGVTDRPKIGSDVAFGECG